MGSLLAGIGRLDEAITAYDTVLTRYADAPAIRETVSQALLKKGIALGELSSAEHLRTQDAESIERANVALAKWLEEDFQRNIREPVRVAALRLTDVGFFADTTWKLHGSVNVLLGRNGYGKSLLLRILAGMLQRDIEATSDAFLGAGPDGRIDLELVRSGDVVRLDRDDTVFLRTSMGKVPLLAIPDERFTDRSTTTIATPDALDLTTHGADHFLTRVPYRSAVEGLLNGLVIDYWEHGRTFTLPTFALIAEVVTRLTGQPFEFRRIKRVGRTGAEIRVRTEGLGRDLEIQRASQGTMSVITIFGLVHAFLQELATARGGDGTKDAREQAAVVLIDEVDAHLHPRWQQKIRNLLIDIFPNVQFVISAHSPLVVAGCGPGEVSVMRRSGDRFGIQQLRKDFVGASTADLYSEVFDVEDLDETFVEYATMNARGATEDVDRELDALFAKEQRGPLSESEENELQRLLLMANRLQRVGEVRDHRHDAEQRALRDEAEIRRLRTALIRAEGSPEESAD